MTEKSNDDENRDVFLSLGTKKEGAAINYCEAVAWGQDRIRKLELENENLSKTVSALCQLWHLPAGSIEEIHQQRRRERLLDEITLICVRDGIERMDHSVDGERDWGDLARDTADNVCRGINEFDAK